MLIVVLPYLARVDVGHELGLPLACVRPLLQEDDPRSIHVRHCAVTSLNRSITIAHYTRKERLPRPRT